MARTIGKSYTKPATNNAGKAGGAKPATNSGKDNPEKK